MQRPLPPRIPGPEVEMEHLTLPLQDPPPTTRRIASPLELAPLDPPPGRRPATPEPCHLVSFVWIAAVSTALGALLAGALVVGLDHLLGAIAHTLRSLP